MVFFRIRKAINDNKKAVCIFIMLMCWISVVLPMGCFFLSNMDKDLLFIGVLG